MNSNKSIPLSLFTLLLMTSPLKGLGKRLLTVPVGLVLDSTPTLLASILILKKHSYLEAAVITSHKLKQCSDKQIQFNAISVLNQVQFVHL